LLEAEIVLYDEIDDQRGADAYRQTQDIDQGEELVAAKGAEGGF